eukprot:Nk52_evm1s423 gene=Nk52_evmTU1s423
MAAIMFKRLAGMECPGWLAGNPSAKAGVVVIQEWWGMNDQIKSTGERIAAAGDFKTLVPDLYRGKVAIDHETAGHYMNDLDWMGALEDIEGAVQYLKDSGCTKVGVTGFCMGGALTLAAAANDKKQNISAASCFYGIPGAPIFDPKNVKCDLILHFGEKDDLAGFSDPTAQEALEKSLKDAGVGHTFYRYADSGHAFTNEKRPEAYNEAAAKLALWDRTINFFTSKLK